MGVGKLVSKLVWLVLLILILAACAPPSFTAGPDQNELPRSEPTTQLLPGTTLYDSTAVNSQREVTTTSASTEKPQPIADVLLLVRVRAASEVVKVVGY